MPRLLVNIITTLYDFEYLLKAKKTLTMMLNKSPENVPGIYLV